jgi:hypothetical protein
LLGDWCGCRTLVREDHENEQQTIRRGGDDEEIGGRDLREVIR